MEVIEERRTFDKVIEKLKWIGGCLKSALCFGGIRLDGLSVEESACKIRATVEELNQIEISEFIGSWLKMPEYCSLLKVWIDEILNNTYNYHKEVEKANFKPEQIGLGEIAENYDRWRNAIIFHLSNCLPDGEVIEFDGKKYVVLKNDIVADEKKNDEPIEFDVLIRSGYMERLNKSQYKWKKSKALLAYTMEKIYCKNQTDKFPETMLNNMFGVTRLGQARNQLYNSGNPPRGAKEVNEVLL